MDVVVMGSNGAIGKRYCAVLRYLGINPIEIDINSTITLKQASERTNIAINCTPTESHLSINLDLISYDFRILCEKPCCLSPIEVDDLKKFTKKLTEVNNWAYTFPSKTIKPGNHTIVYDYFMPGKEKLKYNLWQPIILSKNIPIIGTKSPVFKCYIDDQVITQRDFDMSYIYMLQDFVYDTAGWDLDTCKNSIEKVKMWENHYDKV